MRSRYIENHRAHRIGWLRAAVLGANDGVVSVSSLVVGVAAGGASQSNLLLTGIAGLVAVALSMAAGEYISVQSQADTENADLNRARTFVRGSVLRSLTFIAAFLCVVTSSAFGDPKVKANTMKSEDHFTFTEVHRKLLREARVAWDPTENGAPTIHPLEPFGSEDVYGDIARIADFVITPQKSSWSISNLFSKPLIKLSPDQQKATELLFNELFPAIEILLQNGRLKSGEYKLTVKEPSSLDDGVVQVDFLASERDKKLVTMSPPAPKDGSLFIFTEDHRKLLHLAAYFLRDNSRGAKGEERYLNVPALDPKRPYGDMTYYPLDIAHELGVAIDNKNYEDEDSEPPFKMEKLKKLVALHLSMSHALILYLAEAVVDIGTYEKRDGVWRKN